MNKLILFCLEKRVVVLGLALILIMGGFWYAPFNWGLGLNRDSIAVDAIPDLGENQQIIYTEWKGQSPEDIEDQITYPLSTHLMSTQGVKTIRSNSNFGFSTIYIIFDDKMDFYESRNRLNEKLQSLTPEQLPKGVKPQLGPNASALGQVFWYTLEGLDKNGDPTGGWDLEELRSINDFEIKYALQSVPGVAEVASIGGMEKEFQIDLDPQKLKHHSLSLQEVYKAVSEANRNVGAQTLEINQVEYLIRSKGQIKDIVELKNTVVRNSNNAPLFLKDIAYVQLGPSPRRGALDKQGTEAVGGVVVAAYGENPLKVIEEVKLKIEKISKSLPSKLLAGGLKSQVNIVPFYDRTELIYETLETLKKALSEELLITIVVMVFMLGQFRASLLISIILPVSVMLTFLLMKWFGVTANVVALSGIAIAIGTMVDLGIILSENMVRHIEKSNDNESKLRIIYNASAEMARPIITAISTTLISFAPVFLLDGAEGKLFKPLAMTKTFSLFSALVVALLLLPPIAYLLYKNVKKSNSVNYNSKNIYNLILLITLIALGIVWKSFIVIAIIGILFFFKLFIKVYPILLRKVIHYRMAFIVACIMLSFGGLVTAYKMQTEFMPSLDEGSFLLMPSTMPHASFSESQESLALLSKLVKTIPEVKEVVGKLGRAESVLDPAPVSMFETLINYKSEYGKDSLGNTVRQWREHINSPNDIWDEIIKVSQIPGLTSAPKLMPIETRLIMLASGMRANMGIKILGNDLKEIEKLGKDLSHYLQKVDGVKEGTVVPDQVVGKPYLEYEIDRVKAARYNLSVAEIQSAIEIAIGGKKAGFIIDQRERYDIRLRYARDFRDDLESLKSVLVKTKQGANIPISQVSEIKYVKGPMSIKSENGQLISYVTFAKDKSYSASDIVYKAKEYFNELVDSNKLKIPSGVYYEFTGEFENQQRANQKMMILVPMVLLIILLILYLQFSNWITVAILFSAVLIAWAGGFLMLGIMGIKLSIAVWVGFLALSGIATDDGVLMSECIQRQFKNEKIKSKQMLLESIVKGASMRIRPCIMTSATTIVALIPILISTGRGSDIMIPMSYPIFGGMMLVILSVFVVPVLTYFVEEKKLA